jgi:uncharacterized damage-inducible protein DinB
MPLYEIFKVNSRLFMNCLDAMDNDQAGWRPSDSTNSAAFIALHLVDTRHWLAGMLGLKVNHPFKDLCAKVKSIGDVETIQMPSLDDLRSAWKDVTGELRETLKVLTAEDLAKPAPWQAPGVDDKSMLGLLAFLAQHDSYHVGQMAILRKAVGLQAMSYN